MPIYDLQCVFCGHRFEQICRMDECPPCTVCGKPTERLPALFATTEWGGPRLVKSLDREFSSRSELRKELKRLNMEPAGDRVRGARTEVFEKKIYSGTGPKTGAGAA